MATKKKAATKKRSSNSRKQTTAVAEGNSQLQELFVDALKDLYWAEKALTKALPKMQKKATTETLKDAMEMHLEQTMEQVARLEQIFEVLGEKARGKKCEAMEGLIKEAESVMEDTEDGTMTRDAGIIMAAQKVEHYEISSYGTLVQIARVLGHDEVASILQETLEEEKETDANLTVIAEEEINWQAEQELEEA